MKSKYLVPALVLMLGFGLPALCQKLPSDDLTQEQKQSITSRIVTSIQVAKKIQKESLEGYLAIVVDEQTWEPASRDGDVGSWIKLNSVKSGRSMVLLLSPTADAGIAVFFDGDVPFGVAAAHSAKKKAKIPEADIIASYKPISEEMIAMGSGAASLNPGVVNTDAGAALMAFRISFKKH
jgi:hypothetical protein